MMHRPGITIGGLLLCLLAVGIWFGFFRNPQNKHLTDRPPSSELERQIGQLIMIGFNGTRPQDTGVQAVSAQLADGRIGGVMLLSRNIRTASQLKTLTRHLAAQNKDIPVLIAADQEGGQVQRLAALGGSANWLSAAELARRTDNCGTQDIRAYYDHHAAILPEYHINLNFGPVVDLNLNPDNPVIGKRDRSFSAAPETVARCAAGFVAAHQSLGVATALKHFPGHGSTSADSHHTLPLIGQTWRQQELTPYRELARSGHADMVMMGHLVHPRFSDAHNLPASLSLKGVEAARAVTGDSTVIITDDLEMDAISDAFPIEDAAVKALAAGNDMVLFSSYGRIDPDLGDRLNAAIRAAVEDGRITAEQIGRSVTRIKALKARLIPPPRPSG